MSATITNDECDAVLEQGRAARRANANLKMPPPELDAFLADYWRVGWMREHDAIALTRGANASGSQ